ncbi:MAG: FHIPEP family type III secretion protein [Acetatifactor sp.]|nr:FHIPEP family type III secretion protein [Acetatifactor sp.]
MNTEDFGKRILSIRQNANLTQEELALRMGVTPQAISKWERGQSFPDISIFTDLCRVLNVSSDLLLGLGYSNFSESNDTDIQKAIFDDVFNNIRASLETVAIIFGTDLVQAFIDGPIVDLVAVERTQMSKDGFLLPIVKLRDDIRLKPKEFMVIIYDRVVYNEQVEVIDDTTLAHMFQTLGQVVRKNYGMLLNREMVKSLTDNLRIDFPALIEGVIPEKISYHLLQEVLKIFLSRENCPKYLPRIIESLENALYRNPDASVEQLAEQVCADIETPDNIAIYLAHRQ